MLKFDKDKSKGATILENAIKTQRQSYTPDNYKNKVTLVDLKNNAEQEEVVYMILKKTEGMG